MRVPAVTISLFFSAILLFSSSSLLRFFHQGFLFPPDPYFLFCNYSFVDLILHFSPFHGTLFIFFFCYVPKSIIISLFVSFFRHLLTQILYFFVVIFDISIFGLSNLDLVIVLLSVRFLVQRGKIAVCFPVHLDPCV